MTNRRRGGGFTLVHLWPPGEGTPVNTAAAQRILAEPWVRPSAAALAAWTDDPVPLEPLRRDPGLVLHLLRYARPTPDPDTFAFDDRTWGQPGLYETAAALLDRSGPPVDIDPDAHRRSLVCASASSQLAARLGGCSPDAAWAAGLLAGHFGLFPAVARKRLARWRLPHWLTVAVGFLELPLNDAVQLGGHRGLMRAVRSAARAVGGIPVSPEPDTEADSLVPFFLDRTQPAVVEPDNTPPHLLARLLRATAKLRQRNASVLVHELEDRVEQLTASLIGTRNEFDDALRQEKLTALAEFAAGAGHEINNPLAVISTNVQLLRSHEEEPERIDRFDAILRQTRRIHDILSGTRQFARPPRPLPALLVTTAWATAVAKEYQPEAEARGVTLELPTDDTTPGRIWADAGHVRCVVGHLVRNGIEAAGSGGWVRVSFECDGNTSRVVVEDSGRGPTTATVPHLFDPFYSGRNAGRGRGLGLSIAWRLAQQNGGDVNYDPLPGRSTRFVLTLPAVPPEHILTRPERKSA